jgi:opacity protein-like surface antigen
MSKIIRITTVFCLFMVLLGAGLPVLGVTSYSADTVSGLLVRYGLFMASEKGFKDIYGNSATVLGGEFRFGGENLGAWLEGGYLSKSGELILTQEETKVRIVAIEGGVLYRFMTGKICPYAGAGVGYYMYKEESDALGEAKQNKVGFCGVAGMGFQLLHPLLIDLKVKYSSCKMKPAYYDINIGGITLSAGVGIRF